MKYVGDLILKAGLVLACVFQFACATNTQNSNRPLNRDLFYSLQSSDASEVHCQQKLSDISTSLVSRPLLDPGLTAVNLEILKIQTAPEINVESQSPEIQTGSYKNRASSNERILGALMTAHIRYYAHVAHNYLPIFYIQNPLDLTKEAVFQKVGNEFVTRYKDNDGSSIEVTVEQDGRYVKILTSPFKGNTDMTLRYGLFENRNILKSIELICLKPECQGVERSTTDLEYEIVEGLPLIKRIAFNIGDGARKEGTTSAFVNLSCQVQHKADR